MKLSGMVLVAAVLLFGACGDGESGDGESGDEWARVRGELVVQGISSESSACVIDALEQGGIEPGDMLSTADAATRAAGQSAYDAASKACFNDDEVSKLIEAQMEDLLPEIAAGMGITVDQARCLIDGLEGEGVSFADVAQGAANSAVSTAFAALLPRCTGVAPAAPAAAPIETPQAEAPATEAPAPAPAQGSSVYDTPEFRDLMIEGMTDGSGYSVEQATCILDGSLGQGYTMEDFILRAGDQDIIAAITNAGVTCLAE